MFLSRQNNEWVRQGAYFELVIWEDVLDAMSQTRLQDEYDKAVRECNIFVMLFSTKVGQNTEEEFETAFSPLRRDSTALVLEEGSPGHREARR